METKKQHIGEFKLACEFEESTKTASWIGYNIYPDGTVYTKEYVQWLEKRTTSQHQTIERLKEGNKILTKALNIIIGFEEYQGREGYTYGDTDFDSMSAAKGFNDCLDYVKSVAASKLQVYNQLFNTTEPINPLDDEDDPRTRNLNNG